MFHMTKHQTHLLCNYGLSQSLLKDDYDAAYTPGYKRKQIRMFAN